MLAFVIIYKRDTFARLIGGFVAPNECQLYPNGRLVPTRNNFRDSTYKVKST